jgi:hypothetical protein
MAFLATDLNICVVSKSDDVFLSKKSQYYIFEAGQVTPM